MSLCGNIKSIYSEAIRYYQTLKHIGAVYVSISVLNCKSCCTELDYNNNYIGLIDRDKVLCMPFEVYDIFDKEQVSNALNSILRDLCFSLGRINVKNICE